MNLIRHAPQKTVRVPSKQQGVVLFYALIALVVLLLAAVALVRSVDTATVISGNLSFRQAAASSGDAGIEHAMTWLDNKMNVLNTPEVTNNTAATSGYYSSVTELNLKDNLTADATWAESASASAGTDASGNAVRFVIERMCRTPNSVPDEQDCLYHSVPPPGGSQRAGELTPEINFSSLVFRVTAKVTGPRNTVSYIQGFIY